MSDKLKNKVRQTFSKYPKRLYPKGEILVFAGESPEHIFYLVKGKVRKYDVSYRGEEVIVNVFKPQSFFPMSWAINHTPNKFFYKTEDETELHVVPVDDALRFLKENPDVMLDLLGRIYSGMEGLLGRMVQLMSGTARERLIYELIIECRRFGRVQADGSYLLTINEGDLAARAGLTRETVSREIKKLKDLNWLAIESKSIRIRELPALERELGAETPPDLALKK